MATLHPQHNTHESQPDPQENGTARPSPLWNRNRIIRLTAIVVVVATVVILGHALLTPAPAQPVSSKALPAAPEVGHYAPPVDVVTPSGQHVSLASLKGKAVILNFWYVECEPCRYEMPALEKTYQTDQKQGLVVVGVNMTDSAQSTEDFVHRLGVTYPIWMDTNGTTTVTYQVTATPTSFFIDRQGVIRYKVSGALTEQVLKQDTTALLRQ